MISDEIIEQAALIDPEAPVPEWAPKGLKGIHVAMIEYHLGGLTNIQIAALTGYHHVVVGRILRSELAKAYIRTRMDDLNLEFAAQFHQVVANMREFLTHKDENLRMNATDKWLKAHGRYAPKPQDGDDKLTAEDVVAKLLEMGTDATGLAALNINIDARKQTINVGTSDVGE